MSMERVDLCVMNFETGSLFIWERMLANIPVPKVRVVDVKDHC